MARLPLVRVAAIRCRFCRKRRPLLKNQSWLNWIAQTAWPAELKLFRGTSSPICFNSIRRYRVARHRLAEAPSQETAAAPRVVLFHCRQVDQEAAGEAERSPLRAVAAAAALGPMAIHL